MIDLSHLTEEEQGMIMTVLRRDTDLKKAEEQRISKMEKLLDGSQPNTQLKYRTGEWFYEAKSLRHMDNIHGSEIILASMKPRKAGLDGSLRIERSKTPSNRGLDIVAPPKPARCLEALQLQEMNNAEKELLNSTVRSPRTRRHNPFNRASLIVVEPPETNDDRSTRRDQESSETEPTSPLKSHTAGTSQTSDGSSGGFRPVPKKRTFLSRRNSSQSESNSQALDTQGGSAGIVPAPRLSLQRGSSENSNQSYVKGQDEVPQKSVVSNQVSQPSKHLDNNSQQPSQVSSNSSLERERYPPSITRDRSTSTFTRSDASTDREIPQKSDERDDRKQREHAG
ncbi:Synaptotagmin-like protein 2 [Dissostichus eleginoides]|uniref:Synaptotagmin-like protein 2 n=1 Tax=Dissostichus eleginoides TaxID=100907 RepID=A0AAD9CHU8_DISEL|nr:Synaptotagmin-like protein 2 [Dissostichus eleginoides]